MPIVKQTPVYAHKGWIPSVTRDFDTTFPRKLENIHLSCNSSKLLPSHSLQHIPSECRARRTSLLSPPRRSLRLYNVYRSAILKHRAWSRHWIPLLRQKFRSRGSLHATQIFSTLTSRQTTPLGRDRSPKRCRLIPEPHSRDICERHKDLSHDRPVGTRNAQLAKYYDQATQASGTCGYSR